jgi:pilus assembly protein Flp/PilA
VSNDARVSGDSASVNSEIEFRGGHAPVRAAQNRNCGHRMRAFDRVVFGRRRGAAAAASSALTRSRQGLCASFHPARSRRRGDWHNRCLVEDRGRAEGKPQILLDAMRVAKNAREEAKVMNLINRLRQFVRDDEGQDLIEYALLVGLISLVAVLAITSAGTSVNSIFTAIASSLAAAAGA